MKSILYTLFILSLSPALAFADKLTLEEQQAIAVAALYPSSVAYLVAAYPHLEKRLIRSAQTNSDQIRARKRMPPARLRTEIAEERSRRNSACLENDTNQRVLRSETRTTWPNLCSRWTTEDSENPANTNSAQTEANGFAFAYEEDKISRAQAQQGIDNITRNGAVIVNPLPASASGS